MPDKKTGKDDLKLCIILLLCMIIAAVSTCGGVYLWSKGGLSKPNTELTAKIYVKNREICHLKRKVFELEQTCRWEKALGQILPPLAKLELDALEEYHKQNRKEG